MHPPPQWDKKYLKSTGPVLRYESVALAECWPYPSYSMWRFANDLCGKFRDSDVYLKSMAFTSYQVYTISASGLPLSDGITATVKSIFKLLMIWAL
jgi:hypothetical protein